MLNIPRSTYYKFLDKTPSKRTIENQKYESEILAIYKKSSKRYGAPKIHKLLTNQGFKISIKRVQRLTKRLNIASVMDIHTRKIVGYSFSKTMDTNLIIAALKNAYETQRPNGSVIFHSDLGTQYTSEAFIEQLKRYDITASYSGKGCPYDNACIASFHSILKKEEVNRVTYYDFAAARLALFKYIEGWYNRQRIHGSISYLTPQAKEDLAKASN